MKSEKYKEAYIQECGDGYLEYDDEVFGKLAVANLSELLSRARIDKISSFGKNKGESEENYKACALYRLSERYRFGKFRKRLALWEKDVKIGKCGLEYTTDSIIVTGTYDVITFTINGNGGLTVIKFSRENKTKIIDKFTLMPLKKAV